MAKALYGHLAADRSSAALLSEVTQLRRRVRDLEDELVRLRAELRMEAALSAFPSEDELVELRTEPVLT
jgi:hypothetical protein